jgi:hypothetical protein
MRLVWRFGAISGFLADACNRAAARVLPGPLKARAIAWPIGVALALVILVALLALVWLRAVPYLIAKPVDIRSLTPDLDRTRVTVTGYLAPGYIVTFHDEDADGIQDADEQGTAWDYFLGLDAETPGIVVNSTTPPEVMLASPELVELTGRLSIGNDLGRLYDPADVPGFDPRSLPFPVPSHRRLIENGPFRELDAARDGLLVFGALIVVLLAGQLFGYPVFRRQSLAVPPAGSMSLSQTRTRVWGSADGGAARLHGDVMVAKVERDQFNRSSLLLARPGTGFKRLTEAGVGTIEAGEAMTIGGIRDAIAVTTPAGRVLVGFEASSDRDAALRALSP